MTGCAVALVAVLLSGCALPGAAEADAPRAAAPPVPSVGAVEEGAVREANRVRAQAGLTSLTRHDALDRAARDHVRELVRRRVLDHGSVDPARATLALRLELAGVTAWRMIGENLASLLNPRIEPGREIVRLWLDSPPHRANLLAPEFDSVGSAAVRTDDGTWYVVQVYGRGIEAEGAP